MDTTTERKVKQTAGEMTDRVEASASKATESLRDYQTAMLSATQANINEMFEYMQEAFSAKSVPELIAEPRRIPARSATPAPGSAASRTTIWKSSPGAPASRCSTSRTRPAPPA